MLMLLQILTVVLGLVIAGSRAVCLVSPPTSRKMMKSFLDRPVFVLILGLIASLYGISLFYLARSSVWTEPGEPNITFLAALPAMIVGIVACVIGLAILIKPPIFTNRITYMLGKSDAFVRKIMAVGFVVGLAIVALGVFVYC